MLICATVEPKFACLPRKLILRSCVASGPEAQQATVEVSEGCLLLELGLYADIFANSFLYLRCFVGNCSCNSGDCNSDRALGERDLILIISEFLVNTFSEAYRPQITHSPIWNFFRCSISCTRFSTSVLMKRNVLILGDIDLCRLLLEQRHFDVTRSLLIDSTS